MTASQILLTTAISTFVVLLAIQLQVSELSSSESDCASFFSFLRYYTDQIITWLVSSVVLQNNECSAEIVCVLAQIGALLLLRKLYVQVLRPLYCIFSTRSPSSFSSAQTGGSGSSSGGISSNIKERYCRYGSWAIIVGDLNHGDVPLMREFAGDLLSKGMNVLILDCSIGNCSTMDDTMDEEEKEREERMRNEVVKLFMEDLRKRGHAASEENENDDTKDDASSRDDNIFNSGSDSDHDHGDEFDGFNESNNNTDENDNENGNVCKVEIIRLKDSTVSNFCSNISYKLGNMAKDGGLGIFIHCYSSRQAAAAAATTARLRIPAQSKNSQSSTSTIDDTPNENSSSSRCTRYGPETFLSILNLILPYMMFRGTGAIINTCKENFDLNRSRSSTSNSQVLDQSSKTQGVAECAFYRQLVRSLHYEYVQYGIDVLTVSLSEEEGFYDADVVAKCSLRMLGEDSELDLEICRYCTLFKSLFGICIT